MPLYKKLLLTMVLPAVLLSLVGVNGVYSLYRLEQAAGQILADNYRSIQDARRMENSLAQLESKTKDDHARDGGYKRVATRFERALQRCEKNITEPGEPAVLLRIRRIWNDLRVRLMATGQGRQTGMSGRNGWQLFQELRADIAKLVSINEQAMISYERETRRVARVMFWLMTGGTLVAMLALVLFALLAASRISRPVTEVSDMLHVALNPDLDGHVAGTPKHVDEIARLRKELDALLKRLGRYEDEQNRKLSHLQDRLALVINEVLEGLVLLDKNYQILALNRTARRILGPDSVEGARLDMLALREDIRELLTPLLSDSLRTEEDLGEIHYEIDGAERIFRPRALTISAADGTVGGYLLLFWDVTEQRLFEESRRRFISMLSHQLKTPITSLSMSVHLLREKLTNVEPTQAELLSIATENCNSLAALVSDLIDAARQVTPDLSLQPRRIDLIHLLRSALRPLIPQAEDKGIALLLPVGDQRVFADVDPIKFSWVIANIAGNALRYTDSGGQVVVAVETTAEYVEVVVKDTGSGIAPENLERIFEPYVSSDSKPQSGTHGLGLAIAREIVEAHYGTITAKSTPGVETEFRIRLPV